MRPFVLTLPLWLAAGCSCNDQAFVPLTWDDLTNDYGKWLSMGVAPDGDPVMAYYDVTMGAVGFAKGEVQGDGSVRWRHEPIDGYPGEGGLDPGDIGQFASMAVAPDGSVWVAYYSKGSLRAGHRVGGVWSTELVDAGAGLSPDVGQWASLALDEDGRPVVAYFDAAEGELKVAHHDGSAWSSEVAATGAAYDGVDADGNAVHRDASVGMYASLLIADGTEYIAFYDAAQRNLQLIEGFAGAYTQRTVHQVAGGDVGQWASLAVVDGVLHIAFEDRAAGDLKLASREGAGDFAVQTVVDGDFAGSDAELFVRSGALAVVYFDGRTNDQMLAVSQGDDWVVTRLAGDDGAVGFFNEVVTVGERQFAASYDYTHRTLSWRPIDG